MKTNNVLTNFKSQDLLKIIYIIFHGLLLKHPTSNIRESVLCSNERLWLKLMLYLQPKSAKNRVRTEKDKHQIFSKAEMPKFIITFPLEFFVNNS